MLYEANIYQMEVENHVFWIAESKSLKGCVGQGETSEEAIRELEVNEQEWIVTAKEFGIPIPSPAAKVPLKNTGKFALRLAPNIYSESCEIADALGISMNQYFSNAILSYNKETKSILQRPIKEYKEEESSSKIIDFSLLSPSRKHISIDPVVELEEM